MTKLLKTIMFCTALMACQSLLAKEWAFDVWLDKQKIGSHIFTLRDNRLESRADFKVKLLFINAYRYKHQADESWQGECLAKLDAHTEENKEKTEVSGQQQGQQFLLEKNGIKQALPACIMTFAYWNPNILKQTRLLNPQNAEYLNVTVTDEGNQAITVKEQTIQAHQYRLTGQYQGKDKLKITLWYDQQQEWVALESVTPEGYKIVYKLKGT